jgi:hypothetical protein
MGMLIARSCGRTEGEGVRNPGEYLGIDGL